MVNYKELLEDSFDNIDEEGYRDYNEFLEEDNSKEPNENDDMEDELADSDDYEEAAMSKEELNDWQRYGLDKEYDGDFNIAKAYEMFAMDSIKMQFESIKYATYYAKNRNVEAQNFIVALIQMKGIIDNDVHQLALTSFTLFFRNFVRVQCNKYYAKVDFPNDYEKLMRVIEAVDYCFAMIYEEIYKYDSSVSRLSTFFTTRIIGCITNFEAEARGRASKQTMSIDKKVSKIELSLIRRGIKPTVRRIALEMEDKNVEKIFNSVARIEAENTMISIQADESNAGVCNKLEQVRFETPESSLIKSESTEELMDILNNLSELEREILLRMNNMTIVSGQIIDVPECDYADIYEVARALDMKSGDVKRIYTNVITKVKGDYGKKNGNDRLLEGRGFIFSNSKKDKEVESFLEEISSIF